MAQFDVHRNLGTGRNAIPFLLVVQSDRYEGTNFRVVAPLVSRARLRAIERTLNPVFVVEGQEVVMDPLQLFTLPVKALGSKVTCLDGSRDMIVRAIDDMLVAGR